MKGVGNGTVVGAYQRMAVPAVGGAKAATPAAPVAHEPTPQAAEVSISAEAKHLSQSSSGGSVVNAEKVSELKGMIHSGAYRVDAHRVASQMLDGLV